MEELVAMVGSGLVPILQQAPGFREHFLVETSEGMLSISVFADEPTTLRSTTERPASTFDDQAQWYWSRGEFRPGSKRRLNLR